MPLARSYNLTGRYQEAIEASELLLDRSRKGEFTSTAPHIHLAEAYVGLGQLDKARAHAEEVLKITPNFSVESYVKEPYKDPTHRERRLAALRKAGLK